MALNVSSLSFAPTLNQYAKLSNVGSIRGLQAFSFGCFFKVDPLSKSPNQHAYVERQGTGTLIRFRFTPIAGKLQFGFSPKDGVADTSYNYNIVWDDRWHYAAFSARLTGTEPTYEIWLDGAVVAEGTLVLPSGVDTITDTAPKGIYMGNHSRLNAGESFPATTAWSGKLDEVVLFNTAMSSGGFNDYVSSHEHWELPPAAEEEDSEFLAYFKLDQNSGTSITDVAITPNRTGTLYLNGVASSGLWSIDRPFIGDGDLDIIAPSIPSTNTHTNVTSDGFDVSWNESTDNVWVQFYELQVSQFSNFATYTGYDTARLRTKQVRNLIPSTNYYWRVRAFDAELNTSDYSVVRSLTTLPTGDIAPPLPPTNVAASFITHSSFRITFTNSLSGDTAGYKIDVARDAEFTDFVVPYRNHDVGNVSIVDIFGTRALNTYYVRLRAYDAFDNESNDTPTFTLTTTRQPDITAPLVATMYDPSGVSSKAATLNWAEGVDDTAVAGYFLDVSISSTFSGFITANNVYWSSVDVGNLTEFYITGLEPETTYYYRVRAYDEAGNVANDTLNPMSFTTQEPSIYEGEDMRITLFSEGTALTDSAAPTVVQSTAVLYASTRYGTYLQFTPSQVAGSIQNATLRIYPTNTGSVNVRVKAGTVPPTMTHNTRPTMSGATLNFVLSTANQWYDLDITSLFLTTAASVVELVSASGTATNISNTDTLAPQLDLFMNPLTATQTLPITFTKIADERVNTLPNGSFEVSTFGWEAYSGGAIVRATGLGVTKGLASGQITVTNGGGAQTAVAGRAAALPSTNYNLYYSAAGFDSAFGTLIYNAYLIAYNASSVATTIATITPTLSGTTAETFAVNATTLADTVAIGVRFTGTEGGSLYVDNICLQIAYSDTVGVPLHYLAPFDGDTSGAKWDGTPYLSTSRIAAPVYDVESFYVGDENDNNTAVFAYKPATDTQWVVLGVPTVNRASKKWSIKWSPATAELNTAYNGSFEDNYGITTSGTVYYDTSTSYLGTRSLAVNNTTASMNQPYQRISASTQPYITSVRAKGEVGTIMTLRNRFDGGTWIESSVVADGSWQVLWNLITAGRLPETNFVASGGIANFDGYRFTRYNSTEFLDGYSPNYLWNGTPYRSASSGTILEGQVYDVRFVYIDADGFFDNSATTVNTIASQFTIPTFADNAFTVDALDLQVDGATITSILRYSGDDNDNSTAVIDFKRTDLSTWSEIRPMYDRAAKQIVAVIPNLKYGTNYTVRYRLADADGLYNTVAGVVTNTVTTDFNVNSANGNPSITFGGFALMGREDGKIIVTEHDAFGFPDRRVTTEELPRLHGAVELQALWGSKTIQINGVISGDNRADLNTVVKALHRGLAPRQQRLVVDTLENLGRFYYATLESLSMPENAGENIVHLRYSATFKCADPFAYDLSETVIPTFTAMNNGEIALTNEGDVAVGPYIAITTTSAFPVTLSYINNTTGERIVPKTTIISGDRLAIDSERRSLTKNGIEIDYAGSFPHLAPEGNLFGFSVAATSGTPALTVDARWRHKYI